MSRKRRYRRERCGFSGCRAWAQGTSGWCIAHPEGRLRQIGGGQPGNQNARTHGLYSKYVPVVALEQALDRPPGDLRLEIAVTRALLAELLNMDLPADKALPALDRATGALARLLRTNKALESVGSDVLHDALWQVLEDTEAGGR